LSQPRLRPVELLDPARHHFDAFDSGVGELDDWLQHTAAVAAAAGTAATWVLGRGERVVGYYALAMGSVEHGAAPSRLRRGQPDPVPILLLARLALDLSEQGHGLGADLLLDALIRAVAGARQYGARAVIVDAIDDRAVAFYARHGFVSLAGRRLYRRITDIERAFQGGK
jgi:GNAT superfamily N-acetyltransferase